MIFQIFLLDSDYKCTDSFPVSGFFLLFFLSHCCADMILKHGGKCQIPSSSLPATSTQILTLSKPIDTNLPSAFPSHTNVYYSFDNTKTKQHKNWQTWSCSLFNITRIKFRIIISFPIRGSLSNEPIHIQWMFSCSRMCWLQNIRCLLLGLGYQANITWLGFSLFPESPVWKNWAWRLSLIGNPLIWDSGGNRAPVASVCLPCIGCSAIWQATALCSLCWNDPERSQSLIWHTGYVNVT